MEPPVGALDAAIVRIRDARGDVVGAGFLVGTREIVTCAHVVSRALGHTDGDAPPPGAVSVDFPLIAPGQVGMAEVVAWHPPQADESGDVAGLRLGSEPPSGARPARLVVAPDTWDHLIRAFGFPSEHDGGVWAVGRLRGRQSNGWVQLDDDRASGFPVGPGFSGTPVWDDQLAAVVGMAVAAEVKPSVRTAYLIPSGTLVQLWPALSSFALPACPYRGLSAFGERDAHLFHGREEVAAQLARMAAALPMTAVVGPSGSGKSSLVFAGALPLLRRRLGLVVASCRPAVGSTPLGALAAALLPLLEPEMSEADRLGELPKLTAVLGEGRLAEVADRVLARAGKTELLLVVDQLEELFARGPDAARAFIDMLLDALTLTSDSQPGGLRVLLTLRADFLGQALEHSKLAARLRSSVLPVGRMSHDELRRTIEQPAAHPATCTMYEAGLVERILDDLGDEPGNLPLLEFALTLLWERQDRGVLTHAAYERLGEVAGALAGYAERVYLDYLPEDARAAARRVLTQLVRPAEAAAPTRRMARRADLDDAQWEVARRLAATRLVVTGSTPDGEETVELAHEALIGEWERLRGWVEADGAFRGWQERLRLALAQWEASGRDQGALLGRVALVEAEQWLTDRPADISSAERHLIRASATRNRRAIRRLQALTAGVTVLLLVAGVLSVQTYQLLRRTSENAAEVASRSIAEEALRLRVATTAPDLSALVSVAAFRVSPTLEAQNGLFEEYLRYGDIDVLLTDHPGSVLQFALSDDGRTMISLDHQGAVLLWDLTQPRPTSVPLVETSDIVVIALSPDGRTLATGSANGEITFWDVATRSRSGPAIQAPNFGRSGQLEFSPSGKILASAVGGPADDNADAEVMFWDVTTRSQASLPLMVVDTDAEGYDGVVSIAYGPDDQTLITTSLTAREEPGYRIMIWDLASRTPTVLSNVADFRVSRDGNRLLAVAPDGEDLVDISVWDVPNRAKRDHYRVDGRLFGDLGRHLAFDGQGRRFATTGDGVVIWDADSGQPLTLLTDVDGPVEFAPDGQTLIVTVDGGIALAHPRFTGTRDSSVAFVDGMALSHDGQRVATVDALDGAVNLWDIATGAHVSGPGHPSPSSSGRGDGHYSPGGILFVPEPPTPTDSVDDTVPSALSPDGATLATAVEGEQAVYLWDIVGDAIRFRGKLDVTEVAEPELLPVSVDQLEFLSDHTLLTSTAGRINRWDLASGQRLSPFLTPCIGSEQDLTGSFAVRDGGQEIAVVAGGGFEVVLCGIETGQRIASLPGGDAASITGLVFSPDGNMLASAHENGDITLWDVDRRQRIGAPLTGGSDVIAFTSDSQTLISTTRGRLALWDMESRRRLLGPEPALDGLFPVVDVIGLHPPIAMTLGSTRIALGRNGNLEFLSLDPSVWADHVCSVIGRDLSDEEWRSVGLEEWRRPVCPSTDEP